MSQRKNTVVLTNTAISRLQPLIDSGEYCSVDDAASHVITTALGSTREYSPVLAKTEPVSSPNTPVLASTTPVPAGGKQGEMTAMERLKTVNLNFD